MSGQSLKLSRGMTSTRPARIAWVLVGLYAALSTAGLILLFRSGMPQSPFYSGWQAVLQSVGLLVMAVMGALILSRHPRHSIGWLFAAVSLLLGLDLFAFGYAAYGLVANPGSLPGALEMAAIADNVAFMAPFGLIAGVLLFPDGRFLSWRWRIAAWAMGIAAVGANVIWFVNPGPLFELPSVENPFAIDRTLYAGLQQFAAVTSNVLMPLFLLAGVISLYLRFRRGNQVERQQIKWFVLGTTPFALGAVVHVALRLNTPFGYVAFVTLGLVTLPVATAIAIFKYRLYDVDFIINRTLVYGALTASIALLYGVVVSATGYFLQTDDNLAGTLLAVGMVVVVLRPAHAFLQRGVDWSMAGWRPSSLRPILEVPGQAGGARLSGAWLLAARTAWIILAIAAMGMLVASLPHYVASFNGQLNYVFDSADVLGGRFFAAASAAASLASVLLSLGLSALLFRHKFSEPIAVLLSLFLLAYGVVMSGPLEFAIAYWLDAPVLTEIAQTVLLFTPMIALLTLFPNGRFVPGWTRWLVLFSVPWNFGGLLIVPFNAESMSRNPLAYPLFAGGILVFYFAGIYAQIYRYRNVSTGAERQQTRWAIYGFTLWLAYILFSSFPYMYISSLGPDAPVPWWVPASVLGWYLSLNILPVCLTIAITRYRLWDIDVIVNRTLVYGGLTASILALYTLVVGGMGLLFRANDNLVLPLLATGLAALLFHPLRLRLQRTVNRMMYGERDEPLEVLARLGQRLESNLFPQMVYPTIVETVSQALKLPYAAIAVWRNGQLETVESFGKPVADPITYPLSTQGEQVGQLLVARRAADEAFSPADERILRNIARQAGAAVHAVQLMADLQRSRQQLVTAREEERRRLRRDLHDGLGASLAGLNLQVGVLRRAIRNDPGKAEALADELRGDIRATIDEIRRLVYELRPPTLDQLGLVAAVRVQADQCSRPAEGGRSALQVAIQAPVELPPLPAAVEVAAYRIVQEALTNVLHHARAHHCRVRLEMGEELTVEIVDDGVGGVDAGPRGADGLGLISMRERAVELGGSCVIEPAPGGGTRVLASLPLGKV